MTIGAFLSFKPSKLARFKNYFSAIFSNCGRAGEEERQEGRAGSLLASRNDLFAVYWCVICNCEMIYRADLQTFSSQVKKLWARLMRERTLLGETGLVLPDVFKHPARGEVELTKTGGLRGLKFP